MGNLVNKNSWLGQAQLRYVEELLWWNGMMSRREVVEKFGCSPQQATAIIQSYLELNPKAMDYSLKVRRYLANPKMKCVFEFPSLASELQKDDDLLGQIIQPVKEVDPKISRYLMVAIKQAREISITYQSRSEEEPEKRVIIPHAFGFDGIRYHVRAWCMKREEYRDFSLLRIQKILWAEKGVEEELPIDEDWVTWEEVRIKINGAVSDGVKNALMEDYDLSSEDEPIIIKCRRAMKPYVLYRMGLDTHSELPSISFFEMG